MRTRVLVVDDDPALAEMLTIVLRGEGFDTAVVRDGAKALEVFRETHPDLVLLDLMLPGTSGLDVCKEIRAESGIPIIMLTAKTDTVDVVLGLESGADDYVMKPFKPKELTARIRARLRRADVGTAERLRVADIEIDVLGHQVTRDSEAIPLTPLEFDLLGRPAPKATPGVHPRGTAGTGLGLPACRRHPPGQRARAAAAQQDREGSGTPRGGGHRPRCRLQGRHRVSPGPSPGQSTERRAHVLRLQGLRLRAALSFWG